jgi:ammonium transporter, Amt family
VTLWSACLIGLIGSCVYTFTKRLLERFEIDDPLDNSEIHGFCGIWSIIAVGIFDNEKGLIYTGQINFVIL